MEALKCIIKIIISPKEIFQKLKERPYIFTPLVLILISLFLVGIVSSSITQETQIKNLEKQLEELEKQKDEEGIYLDKEQIEQMIKFIQSPLGLILGGVGKTIGGVIILLISSFFFYLLASLFGGNARFKHSFSLVAYSYVPFIFRNVLQAIYMFSTKKMIEPGLSFLVKNDQIFFRGILSSIDIFVIWHLFLLVLGFGIVFGLSRKKSIMIVGIYFFIVILFSILGSSLEKISEKSYLMEEVYPTEEALEEVPESY